MIEMNFNEQNYEFFLEISWIPWKYTTWVFDLNNEKNELNNEYINT